MTSSTIYASVLNHLRYNTHLLVINKKVYQQLKHRGILQKQKSQFKHNKKIHKRNENKKRKKIECWKCAKRKVSQNSKKKFEDCITKL